MPHRCGILTYAIAAGAVATAGFVFPSGATAAAPRTATSDFNGDGYADLAVGVPDGTVGGQAKAGYVNIVWGGPKGLGAYGSIRVTQATPEVPGTPEAGDRFGASVALVDLNSDGIAELLAGVPGEDVIDRGTDAGMVIAVGGSTDAPGPGATVLTGPSPSAAYGTSVAAAELTGDDNKEIVIGGTDRVVARVIQGEDSMITTVVAAPMGGRAPVLTTGDFDSDGTADLAVAYWTAGNPNTQSHVRLWKWDADRSEMANFWNTDNAGVTALAAGDFDGDGHDDLALGECREIADENIDDPCGPERLAEGAASTSTTEAPRAARSAAAPRLSTRTRRVSRAWPRTATASAPPLPSPTSTATAATTWSWVLLVRPSEVKRGRAPPGCSLAVLRACSTQAAPPHPSPGTRTRPVSRASPRRATPSARRSPRVTATPTAYRMSRSDPLARTPPWAPHGSSAAARPPARRPSRPARSASRTCPRPRSTASH